MHRWGRKPLHEYHADTSTFETTNMVIDHGLSQSTSGRHVLAEVVSVQPIKDPTPSTLPDVYASWQPAPSFTPSLFDNDTFNDGSDPFEEETPVGEDLPGVSTAGSKRKRYECSDNPNAVWRRNAVELLHEIYRYDSLGNALALPCCTSCGCLFQPTEEANGITSDPVRLFRCTNCHPLLECQSCLVDRHQAMPLHRIQEWNGNFFEKKSLSSLGLVYQLGHCGLPCLSPDPLLRKMAIMEVNGLHEINYRYCDCVPIHKPTHVQQLMRVGWYPATTTDPRSCATFRVLDLYRELNVRATVNVNDFIKVLTHQTNPINSTEVPDCYKPFSRMARQWAFLHRLKRSGVGFDVKCLDDIKHGSLGVLCWACPHVDLNLPDAWSTVAAKHSYLYMPVYALDANFRLKNRFRSNERSDPSLAPGSGYFLDPKPYKDFLKDYVSEKDISTCIAFAALLEKDTKLTTGLKTSGVAACACARHELIRPQGIGDLQKGEWYANVDYVFFSAIQGLRLPRLAVSYDIVCQWRQNLWERMSRLPKALQLDKESMELSFGLPTWHAVAHELSCRTANSLTYQEGVGRTDGEGIERIWSLLNPSSHATKEMGEGSQHDSLDDRIDHHNYMKNMTLDSVLARRLIVAIEERDRQIADFEQHDHRLRPELRKEWGQRIADWKANPELPSPFLLTALSKGASEADVRAELDVEEKEEREASKGVLHGVSPAAFIDAGLELEDIQLKIRRDAGVQNLTPSQKSKLNDRRRTFMEKIKKFREHQHIYTPGAICALNAAEAERAANTPSPEAEDVKLWLPSDFSPTERVTACTTDIGYLEARLREGRCNDALVAVRHYLHSKSYLLAFRNANVTGQ